MSRIELTYTRRERLAIVRETAVYWIRRRARWAYVRWLLFEDGQGWLRWAQGDRATNPSSMYEPPEPYVVAPPLRRLALAVRYRTWQINDYLRDDDRRRHRAW